MAQKSRESDHGKAWSNVGDSCIGEEGDCPFKMRPHIVVSLK